jgi:eukaryotic-like serine/threonine-protein kinase
LLYKDSNITNAAQATNLFSLANQSGTSYENSSYGIKFNPPINWHKIELLSERVSTVKFLPPSDTLRNVVGSISVSIENLPQNITTLDQYNEVSDRVLNLTFPAINVIEAQSTFLNGLPAYERIFTVEQPELIEVTQLVTVKDNKAYVLNYSAHPKEFYNYLPNYQRLVDSFEITK